MSSVGQYHGAGLEWYLVLMAQVPCCLLCFWYCSTDPGKSGNLKVTFSRPGNSWNQTYVLEAKVYIVFHKKTTPYLNAYNFSKC